MKNSKPVYNETVQLKKIISSIIEKSKLSNERFRYTPVLNFSFR